MRVYTFFALNQFLASSALIDHLIIYSVLQNLYFEFPSDKEYFLSNCSLSIGVKPNIWNA